MFACGIGITPLLSLLWELPYRPGDATRVYRARTEEDVAFRSELEWLASHRGVRIAYLLGPRADRSSWLPRQYARDTDLGALRHLVPNIARHDVYVCGPDGWTEAVQRTARLAGVPADRLHAARFAW